MIEKGEAPKAFLIPISLVRSLTIISMILLTPTTPDDESAIGIYNSVQEAKQYYDLNLYIKLFFWCVGICTIIAGVVGAIMFLLFNNSLTSFVNCFDCANASS